MKGLYVLTLCLYAAIVAVVIADKDNDQHAVTQDSMECHLDGTCTSMDMSKNTISSNDNQSCGLYAAESAIPNSGLGMYTAKAIQEGERIFSGELAIQTEDPDVNAKLRSWLLKKSDVKEPSWLFDSYFWNPSNTLGEHEAEDVESIIPGLGMLANSHTGLVNAELKLPGVIADLHRSRDPGAGAVTNFHDLHFVAIGGDIDVGSELFVEYGDSWFEERTALGMIPLSTDFQRANELIHSMWNSIKEVQENDELAMKILNLMIETASLRPRLQNAIPKTLDEFQQALHSGTASLSVPNRIRSIEWLEENGRCLDNLRPDISTIQQAGRGAFATRQLRKGQIVAPMPLVHVQRHHMEVYGADDVDDPESSIWLEGKQQLLNYVYGHPESSLLLFPYSPVVNYINHNATQMNVKLQWSSLPNHKAEWLHKSSSSVSREKHAGLIMELVATQDIAPGHEIFLDYGSAWEKAWTDHVRNWQPDEDEIGYVSAYELNKRNEWILTRDELENNNESSLYNTENSPVFTACFVKDVGELIEKEEKFHRWTHEKDLFENGKDRHPCEITERHRKSGDDNNTDFPEINSSKLHSKESYTVTLYFDSQELVVKEIPRYAIQFVDKRYKSDLTLRNAFRHEIHLPNEMVPDSWRDL
jgi:SET domain